MHLALIHMRLTLTDTRLTLTDMHFLIVEVISRGFGSDGTPLKSFHYGVEPLLRYRCVGRHAHL